MTCSIVNSHDKGLVVVGDDHQAIYQFRNSVNALANVEADATYRLTQSFRFGPGIAALASQMLLSWKDEKVPLIGRGKHQSVFLVNTAEPHAILARTNAGLFSEAVQVYQAGLPFHFWGGADGYKLDVILNAYHLFAEDFSSITDKYIRDFKSFPQMKEYGERMEDNEIRHLVKTVETYTDAIPELIAGLKRKNRPNPTGEEIVFTTAHKSKGAEWDAVRLLDDFPPLEAFFNTKRGQLEQPKVEDINLLYVSITRAKRFLGINQSIMGWLMDAGRTELVGSLGQNSELSISSTPAMSGAFDFSSFEGEATQAIRKYKTEMLNKVVFTDDQMTVYRKHMLEAGIDKRTILAFASKDPDLVSMEDIIRCRVLIRMIQH